MDGSGESQLWDILREDRRGMSPDAEVYQPSTYQIFRPYGTLFNNFIYCSQTVVVWSDMLGDLQCWESPFPGIHLQDLIKELENGMRLDKPNNTPCSDGM